MSFPRAAIRRFNEPADTTIPPPGAYDPKYNTDVGVASSNRGIGFVDQWDRRRSTSNGPGSRNSVFVGSERSVAAGAPLGAAGVIPIRTRSSSTCPGSRRSSVTKTHTGGSTTAAGRGEYSSPGQSISRVSFHNSVPSERRVSKEGGSTTSRISRRRSSAAGIIVNTTTSPHESFTITAVGGRSQTRLGSGRARSIPRPPRPRSRSSPSSKSLRRAPSTTATSTPSSMHLYNPNLIENLRDTLKHDGINYNPQIIMMPQSPFTPPPPQQPPTTPPPPTNNNVYVLEPGEVLTRPPSGSIMSSSSSRSQASHLRAAFQSQSSVSSTGTIFDEIQTLAESLQKELSEYKAKLNKEYKRTQELDAKKLELEFINHSLKHQLERYEAAKDNWQIGELNNRSKIEELTKERDMLEEKFHQVQSQVEALQESELKLKGRADQLEEEKVKWHEEEKKYETTIDGLQAILKDEQDRRTEVETKIKQLEVQMDSCYHTCESRMADAENMKETYEVKIQELSEQVMELMDKLDGMRRELETQKTLMDLMKKEHQEEHERNRIQREQQNYIS